MLRKIVGGLYSHRPLVVVVATREAVSSPRCAVLSAAPPRAHMWFSLTRARIHDCFIRLALFTGHKQLKKVTQKLLKLLEGYKVKI